MSFFLIFYSSVSLRLLFFFFFFFWLHLQQVDVPRPGIKLTSLQHSNAGHCSDRTGSLTCCTTRELLFVHFYILTLLSEVMYGRSPHCGSMSSESDCSSSCHCGGVGSIPGPVQWVKGSHVATGASYFTAVVPVQSLAQELQHAASLSIKKKKKSNIVMYINCKVCVFILYSRSCATFFLLES